MSQRIKLNKLEVFKSWITVEINVHFYLKEIKIEGEIELKTPK